MSTTFQALDLPRPLTNALTKQGLTAPFPIQESAIPAGLAGRDIQGRAPTGSGKTLAFGLPLLSRVATARPRRPRALILAPTRELAEQIRRDLAPLAKVVNRKVAAIYGGVGYGAQKSSLNRGVDILVATPGRLEDLIEQGSVSLGDVDIAVLDEADRMADMGFLPSMRRILNLTNTDRQTLLFSATLDGDVAVLGREYQHDPVSISADDTAGQEPDVAHHFWKVAHSDRVAHTASAVRAADRTLVFTRTRHGADRLSRQLGKLGITAVAMHGGRSQNQRQRALKAFTNGQAQALVATDVAARGIHVEDVDVVIHYDLAGDPKDYVHRSGRTARAGATGTVISLVVDGQTRDVKAIQRAIGLEVPIQPPGALNRDSRPLADSRSGRGHRDRPGDNQPNAGPETMRIYVGNLPWRTTPGDLTQLFAEHGTVENASISTRGNSGRSKGYGFVEMEGTEGKDAVEALNGSPFDGRRLRVTVAR